MEFQAQLEQNLADLKSKIDQKITESNALADEKISAKFMSQINDMGKKFAELQTEVTELAQKAHKAAEKPAKSLGESIVASDNFASFKAGQSNKFRQEFMANTITGETSSTPTDTLSPFQRMAGVVSGATRQLSILDFIPIGNTTANAVEYTKEASFTNNAAETAEAGTKPESSLTFSLQSAPVRTIAHFLRVSKQVMDDAPMLASYIDSRMAYGVRLRLENQIVNGNGTAPNLSGMLANDTAVAVGTSVNALDYANMLKYSIIGADYQPSFYFVNPADWSAIEILKRGTADDAYIGGSGGSIGYVNNGLQPTLWGLPVIASNSVPAGTLIAGSSDAMMLWMRENVVIDVSDSDATNFTTNLLTIRAEMRAAFTVFQSSAIVSANLATIV